MWDSTLHFCSHLLSSQLLHISFSILMFSETSLNIKLTLQLAPLALPPHQASNSSKRRLICSIWFPSPSFFLQIAYCNVPNLLPQFVFFQHSSLSFCSFITWPSWYWRLSAFQPPRVILPSFQQDEWWISCLIVAVYSALLLPSPNTRSPLAPPGPALQPPSTSSAPTLMLCEHVWQGSSW